MLRVLRVGNVAVVSSLEVEFGEGLNLLTGETGAGKSIIVDALGLLLGGRASADLIRSGQETAWVEATVSSPTIGAALESRGLPGEAGEDTVLRREISTSGRARATVNGALVPVAVLRDLAPHVASIQGQHDSQGLLEAARQLEFLDVYAGVAERRAQLASLYQALREAEARLGAWRRDRREIERRREMLDFEVREIEGAHLEPGEDESLQQEKILLANAGRLAELADEAYTIVYDDEHAVLGRLSLLYRRIEELAGIDGRLQSHLEAGRGIRAQLEDLAYLLRDYRESITVTPGRLDAVEGRLAQIDRLKRKYGGSVQEILAFAVRCRDELALLASPEEHEAALGREVSERAGAYAELARQLSTRRRAAAAEMARGLVEELRVLAMGKTRFAVTFTPDLIPLGVEDTSGWREFGFEAAEFLLSPNPGEDLKPLARVASGGELSRVLLALRSLLERGEGSGRALVFDEVDAGIGGAVAEVVGKKLSRIAKRQQVICVTHLPQIAAMADRHFRVTKDVSEQRTSTHVTELVDAASRVEEIARLLGGEHVTNTARRHAEEMVGAKT